MLTATTTPGAPSRSGCPVCGAAAVDPFLKVGDRDYWRCAECEARYLAPEQRPSREDEYAHYLHHENDPDNPGYRRFLSKLAEPLLARLAPGSHGLDYGCGPGPALAAMLGEAGHQIRLYDPFFAPDPTPLSAIYDFVTCTEVAEHFHDPRAEFRTLRALIRPGGWLALMTLFQTDDGSFSEWHYRMDPTHVVFYRDATFRHLARSWGWHCEMPRKDVVLMQRPAARGGA